MPVVLHRKNGREWVAIVRLDDLPGLVTRLEERGNDQIATVGNMP